MPKFQRKEKVERIRVALDSSSTAQFQKLENFIESQISAVQEKYDAKHLRNQYKIVNENFMFFMLKSLKSGLFFKF